VFLAREAEAAFVQTKLEEAKRVQEEAGTIAHAQTLILELHELCAELDHTYTLAVEAKAEVGYTCVTPAHSTCYTYVITLMSHLLTLRVTLMSHLRPI
jgi:hypothetical protein